MVNRRELLQAGLAFLAPPAAQSKPNVLFILADDLGWADLACYGSTLHETPNLDRLAESGMKFTCAYTAGAVCSPTRASIMTGQYPARVGITDYIPGLKVEDRRLRAPEDLHQLPLDQVTIGEALRAGGYQTFYGGKWHLGGAGFSPAEQGFEVHVEEGGGPRDGTTANRYTSGCLKFLDERDAKRPFFAFVSYNEPHTPIIAREPYIGHFKRKVAALPPLAEPFIRERDGLTRVRQDNADYASVLSALDEHVGKLLAKLDELKLAGNTVVIFTSDNGGLATHAKGGPTSNAPLRSGKGWLYEGGTRVPLMVRAPGVTRSGSVCRAPVISTDYYPTLLELGGLPLAPKQHCDGMSLASLLRGRAGLDRTTLYWHYPHYHGSTWAPGGALREGDWKLIEFFDEDTVELYRLSDDLGERRNLAGQMPDRVKQLRAKLAAWRKEAGAVMPTPNPAWTRK